MEEDGAKLTGSAGPDVREEHNLEKGKLRFHVPTQGAVMKFGLKHPADEMEGGVTQ